MTTDDDALEALFVPFDDGTLAHSPRTLFLNARDGFALREHRQADWILQQDFKPFAESLQHSGNDLRQPAAGERFDTVLLLPARQRNRARAQYALALDHLADDGTLIASVANTQGAKSAQADLARLAGPLHHLSKHKCRVFWTSNRKDNIDNALLAEWRALDELRLLADAAWWSRPGLFAWDRIDAASALLVAHLPPDLSGHVADLGAGFGYLAAETLRRCPKVERIDLFEADARALEPAQRNLERAVAARGSGQFTVHWQDVTRGLPGRYDGIVMNPPFHVDRADRPELGIAFIERAAEALQPHGRLLLVANRHLPYEAALHDRFASVTTRADQDGFKVIEATRPRRA